MFYKRYTRIHIRVFTQMGIEYPMSTDTKWISLTAVVYKIWWGVRATSAMNNPWSFWITLRFVWRNILWMRLPQLTAASDARPARWVEAVENLCSWSHHQSMRISVGLHVTQRGSLRSSMNGLIRTNIGNQFAKGVCIFYRSMLKNGNSLPFELGATPTSYHRFEKSGAF